VVLSSCEVGKGLLGCFLAADGRGYDDFTVKAGGSEEPASIETIKNQKH
jgi:glycine cleavage system aminomethyltransferase T